MKAGHNALLAAALTPLSFAVSAGQPLNVDSHVPVGAIESVITPTRLRQSMQQVPASVSIITSETIRLFGLSNIPDALRLVPGMFVNQVTGTEVRANYHGTNDRNPRRMNVLVDGVSVYRPMLAEIDWSQLPIAMDDVARIEVTRGPNSASYGPNSMLGVINIITKHPQDVEARHASLHYGSGGRRAAAAGLAVGLGESSVHLSLSHEASAGFAVQGRASVDHDDNRTKRLYLRSHTAISGASSLDIHASYVDGQSQVPFASEYEGFPDKTVRDRFVSGLWTYRHSDVHEIQVRATHASYSVRQQWVSCFPYVAHLPQLGQLWRQNPTYANTILLGRIPTGGSAQDNALALSALAAISQLGTLALAPWCGQANQDRDETRSDLEIQDTAVVSDRLRVVAGVGLRRERGHSQTFLNGSVANSMYRVFGTAEFKLSPSVNLHAGGYAERDELVGWSTSPRLAINADLSPSQTLRFVVSKGSRSPGIVEQRGNFSYTVRGFAPGPDGSTSARFYQSASSPGNLTSERLISREVGYVHLAPKIGASFDVKVFRDELSRLISTPVTVAGFNPSNSGAVTLQGAELQASMTWSPGWRAFLNYSYLDSDATVPAERTQYSRHSGSLGVSHERSGGLRLSAAYYATSGDGVHESRFGRTDFALGKRWAASGTSVDASFVLSYLDDASISYSFGTGRDPARSAYADRLQAMARIRFVF